MRIPGLVPMKMAMRFGARMSVSGDRWAYVDGGAYLLDFLFFFGAGDWEGVVGFVGDGELVLVFLMGLAFWIDVDGGFDGDDVADAV